MAKRMAPEQGDLFRLGPFVVGVTGLRVNGRATLQQWETHFPTIAALRESVSWAVGDMLVYADQRGWATEEAYDRAVEATGYKRGSLMNMKSVAQAFPPETPTRGLLSWSHHALVQGFEEGERRELLRRAAAEAQTWDMLRAETRALRHSRRVAQLPWPDGTYGLILADPPWQHEAGALPPSRETENHYETMATDEIASLAPRVQAITAPNAVLYCWATSAKLVSGEATTVVRAWGFEPRAAHVWVKDNLGLGYWVRNRHEHLVVAVRGTPVPPAEDLRPDSVITSARGMHSEKPVEAYEVAERCYPSYPKVELFAREARPGWAQWGNELLVRELPDRAVRLREEAVPA